jgi:hypothetical protein
MMITVSLTVEEFEALERLARFRAGLDSETLLRCLVGDLVDSTYTGGSDERMYAHQWLDRRFGQERYARELEDERRAEKKAKKAASRPQPPREIPDYFDKLVAKKGGQS